jgi:hypothetical protein
MPPRQASHYVFTKAYRDEQKQREKERKKQERASTLYGVFVHSSGANGGYVVRSGYKRDDGSVRWPEPYNSKSPVKTYSNQKVAQKHADRLNGFD